MLFHAALVALLAAHGADVATTVAALTARPGEVREGNPLFAPLADHPAAFGAAVMGAAGLSSWALVALRPSHPRVVVWIATGGAIGLSAVAVHNSRMVRR